MKETLQKYRYLIAPLIIWDLVWKGIALWNAALHRQKGWFAALLFSNTAGILPIVYLKHYKTQHPTES